MSSDKNSFRTITRLLATLELLAKNPRGLILTDLCTELDVPKSSMHNLLREMHMHNYVDYDSRTKLYSLGSNLIGLASVIMHDGTLQPLARPALEALCEETGEDAYLGILANNRILYIDKVEGTKSLRLNIPVGSRRTLHNTCAGKLFLSEMDPESLEEYLNTTDFVKTAKNTITDPADLKAQLVTIREQGISITNEESVDGIISFAAPVRNREGRMVASVSLTVPVSRALPRMNYLKERILSAALSISKKRGYGRT